MVFLYMFAIVAGVANAVQAGCNASLGKSLNQPFLAALVVVGTSCLTIAVAGLASGRLTFPALSSYGAVPWWAWIGGALSTLLLLSQLLVADAIGAGPFIGILVITGAVTSLLIDHFGWLGFKVHELNLWRIVGGVLMACGVALVAIF